MSDNETKETQVAEETQNTVATESNNEDRKGRRGQRGEGRRGERRNRREENHGDELLDRVVTSKLTPKIFDLQRGDVVVFKDPNNWLNEEQSSAPGGGYLIKRLIGLPGDVVECKGAGQPVTINGVAINETSYIRPGVDPSAFPFSVTVTEGRVFVMGDNRANSADSRYHQDDGDRGLVPISDVVGVGIAKYWPLDRLGAIDDHHEVFKDVPDASGSNS